MVDDLRRIIKYLNYGLKDYQYRNENKLLMKMDSHDFAVKRNMNIRQDTKTQNLICLPSF